MRSTPTRRRVVVAAVAVLGLVDLAGSATAATLITGARIKDGSVHGRDITDRSLTGRDVRDGSLSPVDYAGSVTAPEGPAGPPGPVGPPGVRDVVTRVDAARSIAPGTWISITVPCVGKENALAGGYRSADSGVRLQESAPLDDGVGWLVSVRNDGPGSATVHPWAVCARS